jgi:predicted DNA-binding transcriptional regulator YafY
MPNNRKALLRYKVLDKCLGDRHNIYYIDDLVDEVNHALEVAAILPVSKRQIYADLDFMKSTDGWEAPIVSVQDGKRKYLKYSRDFSIMETPITEMEMEQLETLITSLSRLQGIPMYDWVDDLLAQLRPRFGGSGNEASLIGFEQNRDLAGLRYLSDLINYTIRHQVVVIDYHPFGKDKVQWMIHPYYLKQYNNRWFLLGYNPLYDDLSIVALDRIEGLEPIEKPFKENQYINFDNYFRNIIGVSLEDERTVVPVMLKFTPNRLPYVLSKPLHHSQMIENRREGIISIRVIPNKELISELIWFGNDVEVLAPDSLRDQIRKKIAQMHEIYFGVKNDFTTGS